MTGCSSDFVLRDKRRVKLGVLPLWISLPVTDSAVRPGWSVTFLSKLFCGVKLLSVILNSSILTIEQVGTKMTLRMKPSRGLSHHPGPEPGSDPGPDPGSDPGSEPRCFLQSDLLLLLLLFLSCSLYVFTRYALYFLITFSHFVCVFRCLCDGMSEFLFLCLCVVCVSVFESKINQSIDRSAPDR